MAGLLPAITSFARPMLHLGYRDMQLAAATPLGPAGASFRGHEFHYACAIESDGPALFHARDGDGADLGAVGAIKGTVMGSFMHLIDRAELTARIG